MKKKVALISGVTSGIGEAVANHFLNNGYDVIPIVRQPDQVSNKAFLKPVIFDFSKPETVEDAFGNLDSKIDVFVNCAGVSQPKNVFETTVDGIVSITNINQISPMLIVGQLKKHMNSGGLIILYGSQSGFKGSYDDVYATTKGAIHAFVKTVATKLAPEIRILNLSPGITYPTRMTKGAMSEELLDSKMKQIPLHRFATPEELAHLTYSLTLPEFSFMTGNTIDANGGQHLR